VEVTEALLSSFEWRPIGPANMGGRITDLAVVESNPKHFFFAAASGGVWKTSDGGVGFEPIFERYGTSSIGAVAVAQSNPDLVWVGTGEANARNSVTPGDGVYKSTDGGKSFAHMGLKESRHIGRIAIHPKDPDTVFVAALGSVWAPGKERGLYRTTDGGKTWRQVLKASENVGCIDVAIDPDNPRILYAAMYHVRRDGYSGSGSPSVFSTEAGLFKSSDGGARWRRLSRGLPKGGVGRIGIEIWRKDPKVVYAIVETSKTGSQMGGVGGGGGRGGGAYMGFNGEEREGGIAITEVTPGGPAEQAGLQKDDAIQSFGGKEVSSMDELVREIRARRPGDKVEVKFERDGEEKTTTVTLGQRRESEDRGEEWWQEISMSTPQDEDPTERGGVFRSDDRGETWQHLSTTNPRAFYFSQIRVDPAADKRVYVLGISLHMSDDGGKTFSTAGRGVHPDHHAMWIDPKDPNRILLGNDGGLYESKDRGRRWEHFVNVPLGQFYAVGLDMSKPYRVYGGLQDNGSWGGPSLSRAPAIGNEEWRRINGADGFVCRADPSNPDIVYAESQYGGIARIDLKARSGGRKSIKPRGQGLRFEWHTPIEISPHEPERIYTAAQKVFESENRGDAWKEISGDLAMTPQGSISTIGLSPVSPDTIWAGTNDGGVWVTIDRGKNWTEVAPKELPALRWVTRVEASRAGAGTAYLTLEGRRKDDFKPYVWKTVDFGRTWTSLAAGLPQGEPVYVVREDPRNPSVLYVGTERAVHASVDGGGRWVRLGRGLPVVPVHDLAVHPREGELVAATHGRSVWVLDVMSLQQLTAEALSSEAYLFVPREATLWDASLGPKEPPSARGFRGVNPPRGTLFDYYLKARVERAALVVRDAGGRAVADLPGPAEPGIHRVAWDAVGAAPGEYVVSLEAGEARLERGFKVVPDPRSD
jgi:photosystem II stability/assembly factor-like uncharacterized protein